MQDVQEREQKYAKCCGITKKELINCLVILDSQGGLFQAEKKLNYKSIYTGMLSKAYIVNKLGAKKGEGVIGAGHAAKGLYAEDQAELAPLRWAMGSHSQCFSREVPP